MIDCDWHATGYYLHAIGPDSRAMDCYLNEIDCDWHATVDHLCAMGQNSHANVLSLTEADHLMLGHEIEFLFDHDLSDLCLSRVMIFRLVCNDAFALPVYVCRMYVCVCDLRDICLSRVMIFRLVCNDEFALPVYVYCMCVYVCASVYACSGT